MKKVILSIVLIILLVASLFVLTGCGKKEAPQAEEQATVQTENKTETEKTEDGDEKLYATDSVYDYDFGTLCPITKDLKPVAPDFNIKGLILVGNRHNEYSIESLLQDGYKTFGINSQFYLNEQIEFYLDTDYSGKESDVNILITPHDIVENYEKMDFDEIQNIAIEKGAYLDYRTPEKSNYNYIGNSYVSLDYPTGKYDILFFYKKQLAYYLCIDLVNEPVE